MNYEDLTCNYSETIDKINKILNCKHESDGTVILTYPGILTCKYCGVHWHDKNKLTDEKEKYFVDECCINIYCPYIPANFKNLE